MARHQNTPVRAMCSRISYRSLNQKGLSMQDVHSMYEMQLVITAIGFTILAVVVATRRFLYEIVKGFGDFGRLYVKRSIVMMTIACVALVGLLVQGYYQESDLTKVLAPYPGSVLDNIDYSNGKRRWMYISPATEEEILTYYAGLANRPSRKAERISKYELELYIRDRRFKIRVNTIPFEQLRFLVVEEIRKAS